MNHDGSFVAHPQIDEHARLKDDQWGRDMKVHRVIDAKLPLTWLLSSAGAVIIAFASLEWSVAAQNNKLEQLINQYSKIEARLDQRDARMDDLMKQLYEMKNVDNLQSLRIDQIEKTLHLENSNRIGRAHV